jgi:glycerol-3-phosphate dehydrogenase
VEVQDRVSGATCPLRAGVVINATGAWADRLPGQATSDVRIHPQRGSHLVLDARRFPVPIAIFLRHAADGRRVFVYPWEGRTVVGTTDINHAGDLDIAASITAAEVDYLLQAARPVFANRPPERQDVISTWSGVRPIIAGKRSTDPSRASREHRVWSEPGLVSCSGGKLTTFLQMARDVMKQVAATLPPPRPAAPDRLIRPVSLAPGDLGVPDPEQARRLLGRYGEAAQRLVTDAGPGELDVIEGTTCCPAELRFSLRNEGVVHLDDLMLRRSRLGLLLPDGGRAALGPVRRLAQESLAWDDARWQEELERYRQVIAGHYSLPATTAAGRG